MTTNREREYSDEGTEQLARAVGAGVRELNHATAGAPGLTQPGTVYTVLGSFAAAVLGSEQMLGQLHRFLGKELEAGRLGHDEGRTPSEEVLQAQEALLDAAATLRKAGRELQKAQRAINAVNGEPELNALRLAQTGFPLSIEEAVRMSAGEPPGPPGRAAPDVEMKREVWRWRR